MSGTAKDLVPRGTLIRLPKEYAIQVLQTELLSDRTFKIFYDFIQGQGMDFLSEESQVALYMPSIDSSTVALSPTMLAIVPAAKPIKSKTSSHEVGSIVAIRYGETVGGVFATRAVVGLSPYKITSFEIMETDDTGKIKQKIFDRNQLESLSAQDLAESIGPLQIDPTNVKQAPSLSQNDIKDLVDVVYRELIQYSFERGIYPPEALNSLLDDIQISQKWSLAQSMRAVAGGAGSFACSTSTSSFGCTSTSSSHFAQAKA
jgi:hypothetical protein